MLKGIDFQDVLRGMGNEAFASYKRLNNACIEFDTYSLCFRHIQGSPGAMPASVCEVILPASNFPVPAWAL